MVKITARNRLCKILLRVEQWDSRGEKAKQLSRVVRDVPVASLGEAKSTVVELIKAELAKCTANCHLVTFTLTGFYGRIKNGTFCTKHMIRVPSGKADYSFLRAKNPKSCLVVGYGPKVANKV